MGTKGTRSKFARKVGSLAFYLAIPSALVIAMFGVMTLRIIVYEQRVAQDVALTFTFGFLGAVVIVSSTKLSRLRILIHETKHAALVLLTGNKLTDFRANATNPHVSYQMYEGKTQFGPFIALAPYFFPLTSLPTLIACLIFDDSYRPLLAFFLGFTLATDLLTGYQELHPNQSDPRQVFGGRLIANLFVASFHCMWLILCLLWIVGKREAFLDVGITMLALVRILTGQ